MSDKKTIEQEMANVARVPVDRGEYWALKYMGGLLSCQSQVDETLEQRIRSIPNGWRNYCLLRHLTTWLFDRLCFTIPVKQLVVVGEDLKRTECYLVTKGACKNPIEQHDYSVVPRAEYLALVQMLVDANCPTCDKHGKECKRCKLRRILDATLPYKMPEGNGSCPYNDYELDAYYTAEELMKIRGYDEFKEANDADRVD